MGRLPFAVLCDTVALQERKELIRLVIEATNKAVLFEHSGTKCPVCALVKVESILKVVTTKEEIRYCHCPECEATIKAIGEISKKPVIITPNQNNDNTKNRKRGTSNGRHR